MFWVAQLCLTLCDPIDCSPPAPWTMGILQARILEWVAMFSSRGSSQPRDWIQVFRIAGRLFIIYLLLLFITKEGHTYVSNNQI